MKVKRKNGVKNGIKTQFRADNQPISEAKKAGWIRKKQGQELMDIIMHYQNLTIKEFEKLKTEMRRKNSNIKVKELVAFTYATKIISSDKFLMDWIDRHVSKASIAYSAIEESKDSIDLDKVIEDLDNDLY